MTFASHVELDPAVDVLILCESWCDARDNPSPDGNNRLHRMIHGFLAFGFVRPDTFIELRMLQDILSDEFNSEPGHYGVMI